MENEINILIHAKVIERLKHFVHIYIYIYIYMDPRIWPIKSRKTSSNICTAAM